MYIRPELESVHNIAVFRALKLGDLLCSIPALRSVREPFPNARITLISLPWAKEFVNRFPNYIDDFIEFPGYPGLPEQGFNPEKFADFLKIMHAKQFDLLIQLHGDGTIINTFLQPLATYFAGFYPDRKSKPSDLSILYPENKHEINRLLALVKHLGTNTKNTDLEFPIWDNDWQSAETLKRTYAIVIPYIIIHPGAASSERYPEKDFAHLADYLASLGFQILLTGTQQEQHITQKVETYMRHTVINLAGQTDLGSLAALLRDATLLISNDTGISHLAVATKTPSIILFSTSEFHRWAPLNKKLHISLTKGETNDPKTICAEMRLMLKKHYNLPTSREVMI